MLLLNFRLAVSRKSLTGVTPAKKSTAAAALVESCSDGNAGVVSSCQPTQTPSPLPQPPTQLAGQGRLLEEKNDRISKEKQKFFRSSAFNADHNKLKRVGGGDKSRSSQSLSPKSSQNSVTLKKVTHNRRVPPVSSSSGSEASESDSSEDTESSDDQENDDVDGSSSSSSESSDSSSSDDEEEEQEEPQKSTGPFSCDLNEDKPWGFAAAAAKLNVESPFFSNITNTFGASLPKLDLSSKPTFGLNIQPAASPSDCKKRQKTSHDNSNSSFSSENKIKPGVGQLKGLFDGLSHFFSAPTNSRARSGAQAPNYAPDRRKRPSPEERGNPNANLKSNKVPKGNPKCKQEEPSINNGGKTDKKKTEDVTENHRVPRPGIFTPSDESFFRSDSQDSQDSQDLKKQPKMTPSNLVKTAVNSKRHEQDRKKLLKGVDESRYLKYGSMVSPCSSPSSLIKNEQHSRKKLLITEATQTRHPEPALPKNLPGSNPNLKSNPKPNPRACTSATTTNTTTTPRATPCSTKKGKSLPRPFTIQTSKMHPIATSLNLILAHHRGCVGGVVWCDVCDMLLLGIT